MILLIDNYDSFTYNLAHLIAGEGYELTVRRNDAITAEEAARLKPDAVVLSPGPSVPDNAGVCLDLVAAVEKTGTPLFGVCLGLQTIAQALGGKVVRAEKLMHGKTSEIDHQGGALFRNLPSPFTATRYHSLIASPETLPDCLDVTARSSDDNEIMAIQHKAKPIAAMQFHPESIASEYGPMMFSNFMAWARAH